MITSIKALQAPDCDRSSRGVVTGHPIEVPGGSVAKTSVPGMKFCT